MAGNINATSRVAQVKDPAFTKEVWGPDDGLPAAILASDGEMRRPIELGVNYEAQDTFSWPLLLMPPVTSFSIPQVTSITAVRPGVNILLADDSAPAIYGRNVGLLLLRDIVFADFSNGGAGRGVDLFDLVGDGPLSGLILDLASMANFKSLGRTMDMRISFALAALQGNEAGLSALQSGAFPFIQALLSPGVFQPVGGAPAKKPAFFFRCSGGGSVSISVGAIDNNAGDSFLAIDSDAIGDFSITGMGYAGAAAAGEFFRPDVGLDLLAMADVSKSITAFTANAKSIVAAAAGPGGTIFSTGAVRHQWEVGDTVTQSGMGIGAYDGVKTIGAVFDPFSYLVVGETFLGTDTGTATNDLATVCASAASGFTRGQTILVSGGPAAINGLNPIKSVAPDEDSFILPIDFGTVGAGTGTVEITRITTDGDHPMFVGETQTISGTTSYNETTGILSTPADNQFDVPIAFVADDATGTVASASKTEKDVGVCLTANGAQKDSDRVASGHVNGRIGVTPVADGAYGVLNVTGFADVLPPERFELTDADEGLYTFIGEATTDVVVAAGIWAIKTGSTENYRFSISIDGAVPVFATAEYSPMEVKTTKVSTPLQEIAQMNPGQTIQIMIAGDGTADDPTITDFSLVLRG